MNNSHCCGLIKNPIANLIKKRSTKALSLDDVLFDKKIDVIKIDTEGTEYMVVEGMKKILNKNNDIKLFIEFNPKCLKVAEIEPNTFLKLLKSFGFVIELINDRTNKKNIIDKNNLWMNYMKKNEYANLMCYRK